MSVRAIFHTSRHPNHTTFNFYSNSTYLWGILPIYAMVFHSTRSTLPVGGGKYIWQISCRQIFRKRKRAKLGRTSFILELDWDVDVLFYLAICSERFQYTKYRQSLIVALWGFNHCLDSTLSIRSWARRHFICGTMVSVGSDIRLHTRILHP